MYCTCMLCVFGAHVCPRARMHTGTHTHVRICICTQARTRSRTHLCCRAGRCTAELKTDPASRALCARIRHGMLRACSMSTVHDMKNDARTHHGDCWRSHMSLLRTVEIGDSQKTTQRAPAHAMKHETDTACIGKKAETMLCAHVTCAHALAGMHPAASWSGVLTDTFTG